MGKRLILTGELTIGELKGSIGRSINLAEHDGTCHSVIVSDICPADEPRQKAVRISGIIMVGDHDSERFTGFYNSEGACLIDVAERRAPAHV